MNIRFLGQNILQIMGLIYASVKYKNKVIDSVDPRPRPEKGDIKEGYIYRGLLVKNLRIE